MFFNSDVDIQSQIFNFLKCIFVDMLVTALVKVSRKKKDNSNGTTGKFCQKIVEGISEMFTGVFVLENFD